jgi:hypothetical protein
LPIAISTVWGVPLCSMKVIFGMSAPVACLSAVISRFRGGTPHAAKS